MKMSYNLTGCGYTSLYAFVKTHQIVHLKWVNFIVCKWYFNKTDLQNKSRESWKHFIKVNDTIPSETEQISLLLLCKTDCVLNKNMNPRNNTDFFNTLLNMPTKNENITKHSCPWIYISRFERFYYHCTDSIQKKI